MPIIYDNVMWIGRTFPKWKKNVAKRKDWIEFSKATLGVTWFALRVLSSACDVGACVGAIGRI